MRTTLRSTCALMAIGLSAAQFNYAVSYADEPASSLVKPAKSQGGLFNNLVAGAAAAKTGATEEAPNELVFIRVSREYLSETLKRAVERDTEVNDVILETRLTGSSHTSGTSDVVLIEDANRAVAEIRFTGTVHSKTVGRNGPATLQSTSSSTFVARKQFILDERGLTVMPAVVAANSCSNTHDIRTSLPGLRGRVAEKVAWRRSGEMRAEADQIAARHVEERIAREFDDYANPRLEKVRGKLLANVGQLPAADDGEPMKLSFQSTPTHIQIVALRGNATAVAKVVPPAIEGNPKVAVHVHRAIVGRVLSDPAVRESITMLVSQMMTSPLQPGTVQAKPELPKYQMHWTDDKSWMVFEYNPPVAKANVTTVGMDSTMSASGK